MLIKKLAVPLINEKLLTQAEYCYIATAAISTESFNFIRSRLPSKCKIDIVTGLDEPTDPEMLKQLMKHYHGRVSLRVFTRNVFHANMFLLDLPYRKAVAFIGSGSCTMPGIKDAEEIFWKVTDPREIESIKSWFTGYFEFSEPLTEQLIQQYELVYHNIRQREFISRREKRDIIETSTRGFNWDAIKFKHQFFKKEDFRLLGYENALSLNPILNEERANLDIKLVEFQNVIARDLAPLRLTPVVPMNATNERRLTFGRNKNELNKYPDHNTPLDFMTMQVILRVHQVRVALVPGQAGGGRIDREYLKMTLIDESFVTSLREKLTALGNEFEIEVFGQRLPVRHFQSDESLREFLDRDNWRYYDFWIGRNFQPGDPALSVDSIAQTINENFKQLLPLYELIKHKF